MEGSPTTKFAAAHEVKILEVKQPLNELILPVSLKDMVFIEDPTELMTEEQLAHQQAIYDRDVRNCIPDTIILELRMKDEKVRAAWLQSILDLGGDGVSVDDISVDRSISVMVQVH